MVSTPPPSDNKTNSFVSQEVGRQLFVSLIWASQILSHGNPNLPALVTKMSGGEGGGSVPDRSFSNASCTYNAALRAVTLATSSS